jgi:4-amino-4-deoxy-L-arabinose transferase-like glycosyltransferase
LSDTTQTRSQEAVTLRGQPRVSTLLAILALAAVVRGIAWHRALMMMNDGPDFLWQASRLLEGNWTAALSHPYHPLYAGLTALVSLTGLGLEASGFLVALFGGLLVVLSAWGLARLAFPDQPAIPAATAVVAAVAARFVQFSSDIQSDGIFSGLALAAMWAVVSAAHHKGSAGRLFLAGVLTALTYLTRPEGLFIFLLVGLWVVASPPRLPRRALSAMSFVAGALLLVIPYVITLHDITGVWGLSLKPSLQYAGLRDGPVTHRAPEDSPMAWDYVPRAVSPRQLRKMAEEKAQAENTGSATETKEGRFRLPWQTALPPLSVAPPPGARGNWGRALNESLKSYLSSLRIELLLLIIPGFITLFKKRRKLALGLVAVQLGWLAITCWHLRTNDYITNRHFLIAQGLLLPVAGAGLVALWTRGRILKTVAVLLLVVSFLAGTLQRRAENAPRLEALAWIKAHTSEDQHFATHRRRDGWYAERVAMSTRMPVKDAVFARHVAQHDMPYLVFDEIALEENQPNWIPDGLVEVVQRFEGEGDTVYVLTPHFPSRQ